MASGGAGGGGAILVMLGGQGHRHLHHVKSARDARYVDGHAVSCTKHVWYSEHGTYH